jgi:outer membrane lipoprotein SlyB
MTRHALILGLSLMMLSACVSQSQWTPTVDTYGDSRAQYVTQDTQECRQLAMQVSGSSTTKAGEGALFGGLLGAAAGAAIGAAAGGGRGAGMGAAIGAATGGIGGGAYRGVQSNQAFQRAFDQCMRNRGHNVLS